MPASGRIDARPRGLCVARAPVSYTREDFTRSGKRYDLILDLGGHHSLSSLRRALTPRGTLVIVGAEGGDRWIGGTDRQIRELMLSPFVSQRMALLVAKPTQKDLRSLKELIEAGKVTPVIDRTYPVERGSLRRPAYARGTDPGQGRHRP